MGHGDFFLIYKVHCWQTEPPHKREVHAAVLSSEMYYFNLSGIYLSLMIAY